MAASLSVLGTGGDRIKSCPSKVNKHVIYAKTIHQPRKVAEIEQNQTKIWPNSVLKGTFAAALDWNVLGSDLVQIGTV